MTGRLCDVNPPWIPGSLLQQIIKEAVSSTTDKSVPRVIVRTGTPVTVAALLAACVAAPPRLPDPGAALLFELHEKLPSAQNKKDQKNLTDGQRFGFKVLCHFCCFTKRFTI
jgi:hypothetical protein